MQEWLFQVEDTTAYLSNAVQAIGLLSEQLDHSLRTARADDAMVRPDWALQYCSGFFVIARELDRCLQDLNAAIEDAYKDKKG